MSYPIGDRRSSGRLRESATFFGLVLDGILDRRGISAHDAEIRCGLAQSTLSRIRHGTHLGSPSVVADLEAGLGLTDGEVCRLLRAGFNDAKERRRTG